MYGSVCDLYFCFSNIVFGNVRVLSCPVIFVMCNLQHDLKNYRSMDLRITELRGVLYVVYNITYISKYLTPVSI